MSSKIRNLIIFIVIFGLAFAGYSFFVKDSSKSNNTGTLSGTSANPTVAGGNANVFDQTFLSMLTDLRGIKLEAGILTSDAFTKLQENTKILIEEPNPGRPNPFAPLGNDVVADSTSIDGITVGETTPPTDPIYKTTTKNATSITTTSAVLNASLDQAIVGSIRYFEYGTSAGALTKTTSQVTQSGQGDFGVTISGLSSNKTYYFRSVLSVGDVKFTGDVLSFKTK
jgi:hypothetical protein